MNVSLSGPAGTPGEDPQKTLQQEELGLPLLPEFPAFSSDSRPSAEALALELQQHSPRPPPGSLQGPKWTICAIARVPGMVIWPPQEDFSPHYGTLDVFKRALCPLSCLT